MSSVRLVLFCAVLLAVLQKGWTNPRIRGGTEVDIKDAPWAVQLESSGFIDCVCTILSEEYVLCSANCVDTPYLARFRAGSTTLNKGGSLHSMVWGYDHPEYLNQYGIYQWEYSMKVAKVDPPFVFDETRQPIRFGLPNAAVGAQGQIAGWGETEEAYTSDYLLAVNLTVYDVAEEACGAKPELEFCAGGWDDGACSRDEGAAFVQNGLMTGMANGNTRYCRSSTIFINVSAPVFLDFIRNTTGLPMLLEPSS